MDEKSLRTRFEYILDCFEKGDGEAYMATLDPGYTMFDEDIPFRLDKAAYQRHFELIVPHLENIQFIARDTRFAVHGQAGVIDGYYDFRNKPKDSGYRIRFGRHTDDAGVEGWELDGDRVASLHHPRRDGEGVTFVKRGTRSLRFPFHIHTRGIPLVRGAYRSNGWRYK